MDASSAYDRFRAEVKKKAERLARPLEVSQAALWAKSIACEAFAGKADDHFTFTADGKFGFSEMLVNQCIEYAMRSVYEGSTPDEASRAAYERGYNDARREFAKATGLCCGEDCP